jgi:hypothetical protein
MRQAGLGAASGCGRSVVRQEFWFRREGTRSAPAKNSLDWIEVHSVNHSSSPWTHAHSQSNDSRVAPIFGRLGSPAREKVWRECSVIRSREARVWHAEGCDGSKRRVLVVVATMELDPKNNRYKAQLVEKLARAVKEYLEQSFRAASFVMVNPLGR